MKLLVPLHPFSYKIISRELSEHKRIDGLPYVTSRDILFHHLNYCLSFAHCNQVSAEQKLTSHIEIEISTPYGVRMRDYAYQAGLYIYKIHRQRLNEFIAAQVMAGMEAISAMRNFFDMYNITQDDIDMDSMYRLWTRYQKKQRKIDRNFRYNAGTFRRKNINGNIVVSPDSIEELCADIIARNLSDFFLMSQTFDKSIARQMKTYLLYHHTRMTQVQIAKTLNLSQATVNYHIQNFQNFLDSSSIEIAAPPM